MLNILGEAEGEEGMQRAHEVMARAYQVPGASVHWYGKAEVAPQRKVGHITIVAPSAAAARSRLSAVDPDAAAALASTSGARLFQTPPLFPPMYRKLPGRHSHACQNLLVGKCVTLPSCFECRY